MEDENIIKSQAGKADVILNDDLEFWMTRLSAPLKELPIILLAIPGSHNTMTYTIEKHNDIGPDEPAFFHYCSFISKPIILNWCITQRDDIKQQLNGGIRYLDLRVATKPGDKTVYFLHGLYGSEVTKPLKDIADWLTSHTNEIVILDFQHFYDFTDDDHIRFIDEIHRIFERKMCPTIFEFVDISLQWLVEREYQIFVIYRSSHANYSMFLWPSSFWRTEWPNTVDVNKLINFLNVRLQKRSLNIAFVSQCLLTPDTSFIITHPCGTLQKDLVPLCRKIILSWINEKQPGRGRLNIVIADFVSDNNFAFSKTVIETNMKLLRNSAEILD